MSFSAFLGPCDYTNFWTMKNTVGRSYSSASTQFRATKRLHATFDQVDDSFLCQIARALPLLVHLRFSLLSFFYSFRNQRYLSTLPGGWFHWKIYFSSSVPVTSCYVIYEFLIYVIRLIRGYINIAMSAIFDC